MHHTFDKLGHRTRGGSRSHGLRLHKSGILVSEIKLRRKSSLRDTSIHAMALSQAPAGCTDCKARSVDAIHK